MSNFNVAEQFANREMFQLRFYEYLTSSGALAADSALADRKLILDADFGNSSEFAQTADTNYAYGGFGHPKKVAFNGNKGGTIKLSTQIRTATLYNLIAGGKLSKNEGKYVVREKIQAVSDGESTPSIVLKTGLKYKAANNSCSVYVLGTEGDSSVTPITGTVASTATESDGTYAVSNFQSGSTAATLTENTWYYVYYIKEIATGKGATISVSAKDFPPAMYVEGLTYNKDVDENIFAQSFKIYKAAPQGNFTLSFSNNGDPGSIDMTLDLLEDKVGRMYDIVTDTENDDYLS